jgi:hypothetical protein
MGFEVPMALKTSIVVFCIVKPNSLVGSYKYLKASITLLLQRKRQYNPPKYW